MCIAAVSRWLAGILASLKHPTVAFLPEISAQGKIIFMAAIWLATFFCFQTAEKISVYWIRKVFET